MHPVDFLFLLLSAIIFIAFLIYGRVQHPPFKLQFKLLFLLLTFVFVFSTIKSIYLEASIIFLLKYFSAIALFILIFQKFSFKYLPIFFQALSISGILFSLWALIQYFIHQTPRAFFPNPNILAGYLIISIFSLFYCWKENILSRFLLIPGLIFLLCGLFFANSEGALFSFLVCLLIIWGKIFKRWKIIVPLGIVLIVVLFIPYSSEDPYAFQRLNIYKSALKITFDYPLLGTGPHTFEHIFPAYNFPVFGALTSYGKRARFAHNEYLNLSATTGILALLLFLWFLYILFKRNSQVPSNSLKNTYFFILLSILVHALVDFNLHYPLIFYIFVFISALIFKETEPKFEKKDRKILLFGVKSLVFIFLIFNLSFIYAQLYYQNGDYKKAVKFNPFNSLYQETLSKEYLRVGEFEKYVLGIKKAINLNPYIPSYYLDLAGFYFQNNEIQQARQICLSGINYNPKNAILYFEVANTYLKEENYHQAIQYYQKAISLEPNFLLARYNLAVAYQRLNEDAQAKQQLFEIRKRQAEFPYLYSIGTEYEKFITQFPLIATSPFR